METLHEETLAAADARPDGTIGINVAMRSILEGLLSVASAREVEATESRDNAGPSALAYLDFPRERATWVRTNDVQERMNCEIKRRTRAVQMFPSFDSLVRLVGAVCCNPNDAWLASRNFIDPRSLEPGYERVPLPEEPDGVGRVLRLVREAFDRKRKVA